LIDRIVTLDWAGSKQEFVFRRVKLNPRLPESTFEVKVPPGTEIIDETPRAE
jgi:outer membrane lipoprotein-sorting protein